jgi:hypothetical protein
MLTFVVRLHPRTRANPVAILFATFTCLGTIAHAFSPLLVAPCLATMSAMSLIVAPTFTRRISIWIFLTMVATLLVPWAAEVAGLLPRTIAMTADSIVLTGPVLALPVEIKAPVIVILLAGVIGAAASFAHMLRYNERAQRERLHMQTWQLLQLVPTSGNS